jgi:hypothetical protein
VRQLRRLRPQGRSRRGQPPADVPVAAAGDTASPARRGRLTALRVGGAHDTYGAAAELRVVGDQGKTVRLEGIVHASRYEPSRVMKKGTLHEGCRMTDVEHSASDILHLGCVFQQPAWRVRKAVSRSGYRVQRRKGLGDRL